VSLISRLGRSAAEALDAIQARVGYVRTNSFHRACIERNLAQLEPHLDGLDWLHDRLADDISRQTLVEIMAFRVLGHRHTRLARNNAAFVQAVHDLTHGVMKHPHAARADILDGWLDDYETSVGEILVRLRAHKLNVLNTFLLEQYCFREHGAQVVEVCPGDVVLDGGGCWGDTTLYFAARTGSKGQVHVFEFSTANLEIMNANLNANPALKTQVQVHTEALWDVSGQTLSFTENGPGTSLGESSPAPSALTAQTRTIDDWAAATGVPCVNFIKLDVEGAESRCLRGAERVIRQHRPKLAVALYHSLQDFVDLPRMIDSYAPDYRFHLGHYTIHAEESILFAAPRS
jgi:FkbM family methyltransferase